MIRCLLDGIEGEENTFLHTAIANHECSDVADILAHVVDKSVINLKVGIYQVTPLRVAASVGCVSCIKSLLQSGAFVDDIDLKAQTPLFVSVVNEHFDCVKVLLEEGADPNGFARNLTSPAEMACIKHNAAILQLLLQKGARMKGHNTHLLHIAAAYNYLDCFIVILLHGPRMDLKCYDVLEPSLISTIIRKSLGAVYLELWIMFGGRLTVEELNELSCFDRYKLVVLKCVPMSLKGLCRVRIRQELRDKINDILCLGVPNPIINYLKYEDIPEVADIKL